MNPTMRLGPRRARHSLSRILQPPGEGWSSPDWASVAQGVFGAAAFAGVLMFIAGSIDARTARLARGLNPSAAHLLREFSELGAANWMLALSALIGLAALAYASLAKRPRIRAGFAVLATRAGFLFLTIALSVVLVQAMKFALGRAHPHLLVGPFHFSLFSPDAFAASFPSGHATSSFAAAAVLSLFVPRWGAVFFLLALAISLARIAIGVHYPSDVLGGMVLGVALAFALARYCARRKLVFHMVDGRLVRRGERLVRRAFRAVFGS